MFQIFKSDQVFLDPGTSRGGQALSLRTNIPHGPIEAGIGCV
jgi:hypothetical protein